VVLQQTQEATYIVLTSRGVGGRTVQEMDNRHGKAEFSIDHRVSFLQVGRRIYTTRTEYTSKAKSVCANVTLRPNVVLPNIVGSLLPVGTPGVHYVINGRTIHWAVRARGGFQPHGVVKVDAAGRLTTATVYSGPGAPLAATASYPATAPRIHIPGKLCRA
jgi:hypothetical protein